MSYIVKGVDGNPILREGKEIRAFDYSGVVKGVDMNTRELRIIGTDETRDRDGDIIKVSGWMLENFLKNPVFLWSHDYRSVPLAAATKVIKRKSPASLEFLYRFPSEGLYPFADMILALYGQKIINASSVGFIPYEWVELTEEEREGMSPVASYWGGNKFTKQELLELSGCAVPSNPSALQNAVKSFGEKMSVDPQALNEFLVKSSNQSPLAALSPQSDDVLEQLKGEAKFEDETEPKVHQVPETIDPPAPVEVPSEPKSADVPEVIPEVVPEVVPAPAEDELAKFNADFGVDLASGEERTVITYYKNNDGVLEVIKREVVDLKDLEPIRKVGAVLSRKNREKLQQAKDALNEVLNDATEEPEEDPAPEPKSVDNAPTETGADETVNLQTLQNLLDGVKSLTEATKSLKDSFEKGV